MAQPSPPPFHRLALAAVGTVMVFALGWRAGATPTADDLPPPAPEAVGAFAPDTVVARVGSRELTLGDLMFRYATLPALTRSRYESTGRGLGGFLDDTVADLVLADAARARGVEDHPLFGPQLEIHREQVLRDLYARGAVLDQIDEPSLRQRYDEQAPSRFETVPRRRLRHILVTPVAEIPPPNLEGDDAVGVDAALAKARRLQGELLTTDFETLARNYSEDVSATRGGDLGWVTADRLVPRLAKAAFSLPPGEVSGIVESSLGFHLVEVVEARPGGRLPFTLVRELLYQEMVGEQLPYLAGLAQEDRSARLAEAEVETFPERLPW